MRNCIFWILILVPVVIGIIIYWNTNKTTSTTVLEKLKNEKVWWGRKSEKNKEDKTIREFPIHLPAYIFRDLKRRLNHTRYAEDLEGGDFQYGFQSSTLKKIVEHWYKNYKIDQFESLIGEFPHFKTEINGLDVHFIRVLPKNHIKGKPTRAIILLHGWPSTFYDFNKVIPMLSDPESYGGDKESEFEVVVPSLPGYAFSEAPHKQGFDHCSAAQIFLTLMDRLGHHKFYAQGGDVGSGIAGCMAILQPSKIEGLHLNAFIDAMFSPGNFFRQLVGSWFPSLVFNSELDEKKVLPVWPRMMDILQETGYLHLQATKPNTAGMALLNSPAGLAAYILEKYSTTSDQTNVFLRDGGLTNHFSLDDLLTQVMIYWVTGSISSSMKWYKEVHHTETIQALSSELIDVPTSLACFAKDVLCIPENFAASKYTNIIQYSDIPKGGHFPALEVPELFAKDIWKFVEKMDKMKHSEKS